MTMGPAFLISVGYMDPGNWATDIAGGSKYGYSLLWVLLMSNLIALLLQTLSVRLGIVRGRDLAQASRETYPKWINLPLFVLELAQRRPPPGGRGRGQPARAQGDEIGFHILKAGIVEAARPSSQEARGVRQVASIGMERVARRCPLDRHHFQEGLNPAGRARRHGLSLTYAPSLARGREVV